MEKFNIWFKASALHTSVFLEMYSDRQYDNKVFDTQEAIKDGGKYPWYIYFIYFLE